MRLTCLLLTAALLNVHAGGTAQSVTLSGKNLPLTQVFSAIKKQTGYVFFYNKNDVKSTRHISIEAYNVPLTELLEKVLKDQPLSFRMDGKNIILSRKAPAVTPAPAGSTPSSEAAEEFLPITGRVADSTGAALPGATVSIRGRSTTVTTDGEGRFSIEADPGDVLVVSYVGYVTSTFKVKNDTKMIPVTLARVVSTIDNIVVTGIFNKSKETYTGAARVVTGKELQQFQGRNIFVTLGNIDPAFYVVPNNLAGSDPNKIPEVQLRGNRNLPNIDQLQNQTAATLNTPLIIIDGFESNMQRMMDLNNNQILSVTLLKDGVATAQYGSRGANGVIVISTKQPGAGKLRLTYNGGITLNTPDLSSYDLLDAREKLELERLSGYYESPFKTPQQNINLQQYYNKVLALINNGVNTDWLAQPLRNGIDQNHDLQLEGGDQTFRYSLGVQYRNISGVMKGSNRQTVNGTINLAYRLNKLNFRNNTIIGQMKSNESPWGSFSDYSKLNPYWSPYDSAGRVARYFQPYSYDYVINFNGYNSPVPNPMYDATLNTFNESGYTSITDNFQVDWRPESHLLLQAGIGIQSIISTQDDFKPSTHSSFAGYGGNDLLRKGSYAYSNGKEFNYTVNLRANYNNTFGGVHQLNAGLNFDATQNRNLYYTFNAEGFPDESIDFLGMALQYQQNGSPIGREATTRRLGALANTSYAYDNRFLADLAYRIDGASQFGTDRLFAPFWSAGLGWNLHNEDFFLNNMTFINRLKLRGSYGLTGNQAFGAYLPLATYNYITNDQYKGWLGVTQATLGNPNLEWQKSDKYDVGVEIELFRSRIKLQADVYLEKTSNLLSSLELPYANGFTSYVENIGQLEQRGFELFASVMILENHKGINWSVTGNMAYNKDKIVQLSEAMKAANEKLATDPAYHRASSPNKIIREDASQNTIYAVRSLGIDPSTGKEVFLNKNGEVTYSWDSHDRVAAGIDQPKYRGNFSTLFRYRNLAINASFNFRFGGQLYNQTLVDRIENANRLYNVDARVLYDRWQKPGDRTFFRGINEFLPVYPSSRFVQNESTLTCQNVNIQYDLSKSRWIRHLGMESFSVNANTGELFYISTVKQERGLGYPFTRQFSLSVFATF